ncbi:MAG: Fic family protein [Gammaproteobacteria bacterium]|nr:Fic family protein [Gammaproteobacteria bacterium]
MFFSLEKPDCAKIDQAQMLLKLAEYKGTLVSFLKKISNMEYLYWDKMRHKEPAPNKFTKEELWLIVKMQRELNQLQSVIKDSTGQAFNWSKLDYFADFLHEADHAIGEDSLFERLNKKKLLMRGLMDEAIASSQLEGAATSRLVAKKMLKENRKPRNHSERMIVNNYIAMSMLEKTYKDHDLTLDMILELHEFITMDTVDSENEVPRLRHKRESVYITDNLSGQIYYEAPDVAFVEKELKFLIEFANDKLKEQTFIHPIIKAIMLHFWLGYLHPFTDGNGRLARLLFYWYLMRHGYWYFAYLPISKIIKRSPKQYIMAYVYTEQDDNDLNYFIHYNIKKIKLALNDFGEYLKKQSAFKLKIKHKYVVKYDFNIRQMQLLQYLYDNPEERTSLKVHMNIYQVSKMTAIKDLRGLLQQGLLLTHKQGRNVYYRAANKLKSLF